MNKIIEANKILLAELIEFLNSLNAEDYTHLCCEIGDRSIGQHTRHIIEMYQCLLAGYEEEKVNYDLRKRNLLIETELDVAKKTIQNLINSIDKKNVSIELTQDILDEPVKLESNYYRELFYNFEHCIHHKALIKVASLPHSHVDVSHNFGVAPSTLKFEKNVHS